MIHKALALAQPGDVLVVDGSGEISHALVGGLRVRGDERVDAMLRANGCPV